jgi:hypothetical protein
VFVLADDHSVGCFYQSKQNGHRRYQRACVLDLCYAHPSVRSGLCLLWNLCLFTWLKYFEMLKITTTPELADLCAVCGLTALKDVAQRPTRPVSLMMPSE